MENASRALLMAAGVLVGVMILGIAAYLFSIYGQYSRENYEKMSDAQIAQFNTQFLKYYGEVQSAYIDVAGNEQTRGGTIICNAHDIITVANLANQNNTKYALLAETQYRNNTLYIQVALTGEGKNLEKWTQNKQIQFLKEHASKEYICKEVNISPTT